MGDATLLLGLGLIAGSLLLVIIEAFTPSGGILSVLAILAAVSGVVALFMVDVAWGLVGLLTVVVGGPIVAIYALNVMPNTYFGRKVIFGDGGDQDAVSLIPQEERDKVRSLVGAEGVALNDLRPVGEVRLETGEGAVSVEALSEVSVIETGARVRVSRIEDGRIKVRAV